jgi:hypothetical protein
VAPGQAAVVYDGDRVLGGGWIAGTDLRGGRGSGRLDRPCGPPLYQRPHGGDVAQR